MGGVLYVMARNRKETKFLFVHCSATAASQDIGVREINAWHLDRGIYSERGLTGYHFVIRRNGLIELGRDLASIGAHVIGFNSASVGICLVGGEEPGGPIGEDNFNPEQFAALEQLVRALQLIYPTALVAPHSMVAAKACPSFDLWAWQKARFGKSDEKAAKKLASLMQGK